MRSSQKGFTLVEIMVVVGIIVLLATIAIPNLLKAKAAANKSAAIAILKALSTATEMYATANNGNYPTDENKIVSPIPPYMNKSYCEKWNSGYWIHCRWNDGTIGYGYNFAAEPGDMALDKSVYVIRPGGELLIFASQYLADGYP